MKKFIIIGIAFTFFMTGVSGVFASGDKRVCAAPLPEDAGMFKTFCAVGDSLTQGFISGSVDETRQCWSFPNRLAELMGTEYNMGLLKFPGLFLNLHDVARGNIRWWQWYLYWVGGMRRDGYANQEVLNTFASTGATVSNIQRPYIEPPNPFFKLASAPKLSGEKYVKSLLDQAMDRKPTFLSLFIGNNDVLGATYKCNLDLLTDPGQFRADYRRCTIKVEQNLKENGGSIQGVVLATLPDVSLVPFLDEDTNPKSPPGTLKPFMLYMSTKSLRQTPESLAKIQNTQRKLNDFIREVAETNHWALADIDETFNKISQDDGMFLRKSDGTETKLKFNLEYGGGLFSLDGLHPSATGAAVMANRFARAINEQYGDLMRSQGIPLLKLVDEYQTAENDELYMDPYDPRVLVNSDISKTFHSILNLFS